MSKCGCYYDSEIPGDIEYCPLHAAAVEMHAMLGELWKERSAVFCRERHDSRCAEIENLLDKSRLPLTDSGKKV